MNPTGPGQLRNPKKGNFLKKGVFQKEIAVAHGFDLRL